LHHFPDDDDDYFDIDFCHWDGENLVLKTDNGDKSEQRVIKRDEYMKFFDF